MEVLATPKKNPYILNGLNGDKIIKSKSTNKDISIIEERAAQFRVNNLKKKGIRLWCVEDRH